MRTFYLAPERWQEPYVLDEAESRHAASVLRLKTGETVEALDGQGRLASFLVTSVAKREVRLDLVSEQRFSRPAGVTLALGYTRETRRSWLLEKAVELEADAVWFWQADRSQGKVPEREKDTWHAQLIAGAKQSRNPHLPRLRTFPNGLESLLATGADFSRVYVPHESAPYEALLRPEDFTPAAPRLFILGPEGGFSERESLLMQEAGTQMISLGRRILRWETAALLCLGLTWWLRQPEVFSPD